MNFLKLKRVRIMRFTPTAQLLHENLETGFTIIDSVGSEIRVGVLPSRVAKKPTQTVP